MNIVGDGSNLNQIKDIAVNNKIKNVIFHGRKPLDDMPAVFNASDILIISLTSAEIFKITIPSKFQAYLKSNKPIMGIIDGELKSIIEKYNLGKVAHPDNVDEISEVFENLLLEDKVSLQEMGLNAKRVSTEIFDRDRLIHKITGFVEKRS